MPTSLAKFLLDRIAEDEAAAYSAADYDEVSFDLRWRSAPDLASDCGLDEAEAAFIARYSPVRVLAECAAKRSIIEGFLASTSERQRSTLIEAMAFLAEAYDQHPDYTERWRPGQM